MFIPQVAATCGGCGLPIYAHVAYWVVEGIAYHDKSCYEKAPK